MRRHRHPANVAHHDDANFSARCADIVAGFMGSWSFIWAQSVFIVLWMVFNSLALFYHWDEPPFIMLNLVFSIQAAFSSPLILLAQNRQSEHDRKTAEFDYQMDKEALDILRRLEAGISNAHEG